MCTACESACTRCVHPIPSQDPALCGPVDTHCLTHLIHSTAMLANAVRVVGRARPFSVRQQHVPIIISLQQSSSRRHMSAAAAGAGEQLTGSLEQMSVNELQELLANPVLVGSLWLHLFHGTSACGSWHQLT